MYYGEEIGMTNLSLPRDTALDPVPHKFKFIPRFVFDLLGLTINRDEVRTPMQWDATRNAGFSSAQKTWLPVHENSPDINVENENGKEDSLLNTIRALLKIRKLENSLQEGSLELTGNLPDNVLGYSRKFEGEKIIVLLNFGKHEKVFQLEHADPIFKLSKMDEIRGTLVHMNGYGGMILKG